MRIIKVSKKNIKAAVTEAVEIIRNHGVVVCPTDTIYGFVASVASKKAVEKIFRIKVRPSSKVFPVFVSDVAMAKEWAQIDSNQEKFLKKYWPGKLTAVLKRKGRKKLYGLDKTTIGIRVSANKIIKQLCEIVDSPLVQTSVNISGEPPINAPQEIINQFANSKYQPDLIIDAGPIKKGYQSTLVDLTAKEPKILRQGTVIPLWPKKH